MERRWRAGGAGRPTWAVLLCALVLAAGATWAPRADAYVIEGQRWPTRTITYHNLAPAYAWSLARAVEAWNQSGTRLRFEQKSKSRAQVLVRPQRRSIGCAGWATIGFVPRRAGGGRVFINRGCDRFIAAGILAHELGHILGLGHEDRRCATMNSILWSRCPDTSEPGQWRCRLLERDDARGAVRRYGGIVQEPRPEYCWVHPPPPPPTDVRVTPNPPTGADALLEWRNTSSPNFDYVLVVRKRGTCPTGEADGDESFTLGGAPGSLDSFEDAGEQPLETGSYCYAFWSVGTDGRTGASVTAWMDYTDMFLPPTGVMAEVNPPAGPPVRLDWTTSPNPYADTVLITRKADTCPQAVNDPSAWYVDSIDTVPGVIGSADDWEEPASGRWCYALWTVSAELVGRHSRLPATVFVDYP